MMKDIGMLHTYSSAEITHSHISIGFECLDRDLFTPEKCYVPLGKTGIKYARCQTGWAKCEKEKGVYDFVWLDRIVDSLLTQGVQPWFNVGFGNPIYMPDANNPTAVGYMPFLYGEEVIQAWKNYVKALAIHFKDRVKEYELWNEPNLKHFWAPDDPDATVYAKFAKETGAIIRMFVENARIGVNVSNPYTLNYIQTLLSNLSPSDIDFYTYHIYTRLPGISHYTQFVRHLRQTLDQNGFSHVVLWQGEGGCPSWAPEGHGLKLPAEKTDERRQAIFVLRQFFSDFFDGAERSSFFQMVDLMEKPYQTVLRNEKAPARHGILNGITYTPKESYYAISRLATILSGNLKITDYLFTGWDIGNESGSVRLQTHTFIRNGYLICAYWKSSDVANAEELTFTFEGVLTTETYSRFFNSIVAVDMYTGKVYQPEESDCFELTGTIRWRNLPIADYPILLCDKNAIEIDS